MELLEYWRIIRKRLWLMALLVVVAAAGAAYYVQQQVPLYTTSTKLFLNPVSPSPLLPYQTAASAQSLANTYVEFMRTRSFAGLVADELEFDVSAGEVLGSISSELVAETQFFQIRATHPNPEVAQALADTAAQVLIAENIARQQAQRQQLEAQRDPTKLLERQRLTELQKTLQDELSYMDDRITSVEEQIAELEDRPPSEDTDQRILGLREELVQHQSLRVELFGSLAQTQAALANIEEMSNVVVDTAVVVDPAPLPTAPQPRQLVRSVLLAAVAALGLGVGLAFLLEYIDYTIKTPEELDTAYGMATLGVIGAYMNENGRKSRGEDLITLAEPRSPVSEAFRALRTNLQFASPGNPLRSLLVTSAGPVEGKTSVSANLAVILAQAGNRVILVDTDLRRPRLHRVFDIPREPGFTNLVADQEMGLETCLHPTPVANLRVMPCGPLPRSPAELLGSPPAVQVMDRLKDHADVVIYDSPPAATVTDAVVLGSRVDGVLHVVQAGGPRRDLVLRAKTLLEKVGARILGPVLNQVSLSDMGYYTYYYYYGYHGDGHEPEERSALRRWLRRRRAGGRESLEGSGPKQNED
jgi:succinoglycan biosynthesis transport protein ExoP